MRDVKVFINGVEVPDKLIEGVSIRYERIPGVSRCTLSLIDYYGVFTPKPLVELDGELAKFNKELVEMYKWLEFRKGEELIFNQPVIVEGDLVWVFEKINNNWWWGFFGYVNSWEYSFFVTGRRGLSVSCEDSLRPLRYEKVVMHELLTPNFIPVEESEDVEKVKKAIDKWLKYEYTVFADNLQGLGFFDKIRRIFMVKLESLRGDELANKEYIEEELNYFNLKEFTVAFKVGQKLDDSQKFSLFTQWSRNIFDSIFVGDDAVLVTVVNELKKNLVETRSIKRNIYLFKISFDRKEANNVFSFLTMQLNFSSLNVSHIAGVVKIELLKRALEGAGYECFVLPSGDVVIEPFWFGMLKNYDDCMKYDAVVGGGYGIDDSLCVLDRNKVLSFSVGYSGNDIHNVVSVKYALSVIGVKEFPAPAASVYAANKVYRHGFREAFPSFFMWNVVDENTAIALGYYELLRNWWLVRTINCSVLNPGGIYLINRPVYYGDVDAIFHITSCGIDIDKDKKMRVVITGKGGLFNNGKGEYKLECFMNAGDLVFEVKDIIDCFLGVVDKSEVGRMSVVRKREETK